MELYDRIHAYLTGKLYPFWYARVAAAEGGFTTHFDRNGRPSGETDKTIIQQTRSIFMLSHAIRNGYDAGKARGLLKPGMEWFLKTFKDTEHEGWLWIVDKDGKPKSTDKIMYGQSFVIYCMSECALATGNAVARTTAEQTFALVQKYAADTRYGGYREMFLRDWQPRPSGAYGGDRKSFDVHMHLMEAYTTLYELTRAEVHRRKLLEVMDLLWARMFHEPTWTGIAQYALDLTPLPAIMFKTVWGADRDNEGAPRPLNNTSYGHNIEFLWLFLHALEVLGMGADPWKEKLSALAQHTVRWDYLGHAWKNNYHTTRSMVQTLIRLKKIEERGLSPPDGRGW